MSKTLVDLNEALFAQLGRLADAETKDDQLKDEIERSQAITSVAKTIINNAQTALEGAKLQYEYRGYKDGTHPKMLGNEGGSNEG